jgi:hypothetical protein
MSSKAITMFLDPHIAISNLDGYTDSLNRALGAAGRKLVVKAIGERLQKLSGLEPKEFEELRDCVEYVKNAQR